MWVVGPMEDRISWLKDKAGGWEHSLKENMYFKYTDRTGNILGGTMKKLNLLIWGMEE